MNSKRWIYFIIRLAQKLERAVTMLSYKNDWHYNSYEAKIESMVL